MSEITKQERARRKAANTRRNALRQTLKKQGKCFCGEPLMPKPKGGTFCYCFKHYVQMSDSAQKRYSTGESQAKPAVVEVIDKRLRDRTHVRRRIQRDGMGRSAWWWLVSANIQGTMKLRRFSVSKYGDRGAFNLAVAQRKEWDQMEKEARAAAWKPYAAKARELL